MVKILDRKLSKETLKHYLGQSVLAAVVLFFGLNLPFLKDIVLVAAVGSSAFVVFAMPSSKTSNPRNVIGSHLICGLIGFSFYNLYPTFLPLEAAVSIALGVAMFAMVSLWVEHPPAGGTVIYFVLHPRLEAFVSLLLLASIMATLSYVIRPYLKDLV